MALFVQSPNKWKVPVVATVLPASRCVLRMQSGTVFDSFLTDGTQLLHGASVACRVFCILQMSLKAP